MLSIIIAFPKTEDADKIKVLLTRSGYHVTAVCSSGASVISLVNELDEGIVICGYRFGDMHYSQLHTYLPKEFEMLLLASPTRFEDCVNNDIVCLRMPIKSQDLLNTLQMMTNRYMRQKKKRKIYPVQRNQEESAILDKAKGLLMNRNNMSEEEAHRYIQKTSMDSGTNMIETAEMILCMLD